MPFEGNLLVIQTELWSCEFENFNSMVSTLKFTILLCNTKTNDAMFIYILV